MKFFSVLGSVADRLSIVAGALFGSQCPEFFQQYRQRLAGHVDALQIQLIELRRIASLSNKSMEQYIQKFILSDDADFSRQGSFMEQIVIRHQELNQALEHLTGSSVWTRPYFFLKELHGDIFHSTLAAFQPGINLTTEGLCYAGLGMLLGWTIYRCTARFFSFVWAGMRTTQMTQMVRQKPGTSFSVSSQKVMTAHDFLSESSQGVSP